MASPPDPDDDIGALRARLLAAEAGARQVEEWLDVTFQTSPAAMGIISSLENRYVRANPALAEIYGMPVEEILSSDPFTLAFKLTHPDDLVAEQKLFAEIAAGTRRSYQIEKRVMRPDGSHRFGLLTFSGIFEHSGDPASALRFVVVQFIDISTQRSLAETLQRREEELRHAQKIDGIGRLAAGIAHDFNNLLTVIMGHGEVLKSQLEDGAAARPGSRSREDLDAILSAAERAASLTAQLLAHGRRETVLPKTFVLSEAVETLQRLLGRIMGSNVTVEHSLSACGAIFADQGQVGQVVMNLMLNARDAIPEGGTIHLATRDVVVEADSADTASPGPGEWVTLVVSDTGHGMTPEVQARMFEPFFTTRSDRPGTQGTGLGLATVQRIVAEVGGRIAVTSTSGQGSTFTVFFPRVANAPKSVEASTAYERPRPAPNSIRVMVVEDEPAVRSLVGIVLLGAHYRVMVARNGEEALQVLAADPEPVDLVVTDLVMPKIGGATLAQHLAKGANPPRMLFISGYSDHTPADLLPHGELLPKPFTPAQLLLAVHSALGDPS